MRRCEERWRTRREKKKRSELTKPPKMVSFSEEAKVAAHRRRAESVSTKRRAEMAAVWAAEGCSRDDVLNYLRKNAALRTLGVLISCKIIINFLKIFAKMN